MRPQNVLILCSDEHARQALGCYGHDLVKTPTLDRLASQGQRFTRAYTPSPICISARASLATGLAVHEHRCWSSAEPYHGQHESWMHRLRARDHAVVSIGKLHFRSSDDDNGFSEEILPLHLANGGKGWPQALLRRPLSDFAEASEMARDVGPGDSAYTDYDRDVAAEAARWLRRYPQRIKNKPWTLFVSFVSPHYPLMAPQPFYDLYADQKLPPAIAEGPDAHHHPVMRDLAKFWDYDSHFDPPSRERAKRAYFGLSSFLDDNIRQTLEALEDSGAARDTLVLYISDHGEMLGNHGFWGKSVMYEDSVGIPLLMSGPEVPTGVNDTPVSLTDIAATVEHAVGMTSRPAEEPWQSRPLQDFAATAEPHRFLLSQYHDGGSSTGFYMLRHDDWKYIHYAGGFPPQLFNMVDDPEERVDLGEAPEFEKQREALYNRLTDMLDPEAVNDQAFADQATVLDRLGGREAVEALPGFNHTPVG